MYQPQSLYPVPPPFGEVMHGVTVIREGHLEGAAGFNVGLDEYNKNKDENAEQVYNCVGTTFLEEDKQKPVSIESETQEKDESTCTVQQQLIGPPPRLVMCRRPIMEHLYIRQTPRFHWPRPSPRSRYMSDHSNTKSCISSEFGSFRTRGPSVSDGANSASPRHVERWLSHNTSGSSQNGPQEFVGYQQNTFQSYVPLEIGVSPYSLPLPQMGYSDGYYMIPITFQPVTMPYPPFETYYYG